MRHFTLCSYINKKINTINGVVTFNKVFDTDFVEIDGHDAVMPVIEKRYIIVPEVDKGIISFIFDNALIGSTLNVYIKIGNFKKKIASISEAPKLLEITLDEKTSFIFDVISNIVIEESK